MKIGLNLIATNKYISFVPNILGSIEMFFFVDDQVDILIHTNMETNHIIPTDPRIRVIPNEISHEDWPFTTLKRFHYFLSARKYLEKCEVVFYIDVDSLFIGELDKSMLRENGLFGTLHPCLFNGEGTPERNPLSTACIPPGSGNSYFCGGFFGGKTSDFMQMCEMLKDNIDSDLENEIIAIWHDESHLNKYFFDNKPTVVFSPPFAVAENITKETEESKIRFLDKKTLGGHDYFRW
jgi:histo-blood group ABO system transferase